MRKIFVHIGDQKCGSTTIQSLLWANKEKFERTGYEIPESLSSNRAYHNRLAAACYSFEALPDRLRRECRIESEGDHQSLKQDVIGALSQCQIISYEGLANLPREAVEHLGAMLSGFDVRIICYLRRQDNALLSRYSQAITAGWTDPKLKRFYRRNFEFLDYATWLTPWRETFSELHVRNLSRDHLKDGDLIADFLSACEVGEDGFSAANRENESLSLIGQEVMLKVNQAIANLPSEALLKRVRIAAIEWVRENTVGPRRALDKELASSLQADFASCNSELARLFMPDGEAFFDAIPDGEVVCEMPAPEQIDRLVEGAFQHVASKIRF